MPLVIYKKEGETPLEALERLRHEKNINQDESMTYAGRLDPMAEGLLLILVGEECKRKPEYLGLDKEYEIEVLFGVGSDTGDILGIVEQGSARIGSSKITKEDIQEKLNLLIGKRFEKYPAYSSRTVNGKPLFMHTREGTLDDIEIPEKEIEIYSANFISLRKNERKSIVATAIERISKIKGDFRQNEIIHSWNILKNSPDNSDDCDYFIVTLQIRCSSGAYMRTLAEKLGESLGVRALAWKIKRTKIGEL